MQWQSCTEEASHAEAERFVLLRGCPFCRLSNREKAGEHPAYPTSQVGIHHLLSLSLVSGWAVEVAQPPSPLGAVPSAVQEQVGQVVGDRPSAGGTQVPVSFRQEPRPCPPCCRPDGAQPGSEEPVAVPGQLRVRHEDVDVVSAALQVAVPVES